MTDMMTMAAMSGAGLAGRAPDVALARRAAALDLLAVRSDDDDLRRRRELDGAHTGNRGQALRHREGNARALRRRGVDLDGDTLVGGADDVVERLLYYPEKDQFLFLVHINRFTAHG